MKKLMVVAALAMSSAAAHAVDRVAKFDLNADGKVSYEELTKVCEVRKSLFDVADKDKDGFLSNKEMREGRSYLFSSCAK
jgi:Ca2+-binding EF-hand superfamily protein